MSSDRPVEPAGPHVIPTQPGPGRPEWTDLGGSRWQRLRHPGSWPLRTRMLAALVGLLAVALLAIGGTTLLALHTFLIGRLDGQLRASSARSTDVLDDSFDNNRPPTPLQDNGALIVRVVNGTVVETLLNSRPVTLADRALATLTSIAPDAGPVTLDLGGALGWYRVVAHLAPDGDLLVSGLPMADVRATLESLAVIEAAVSGLALLSVAGLGTVIVRRSLRPLDRIAATAARVSRLQLDRGEVALSERVPASDTDPRTEVGQVGAAINRMLGHIGRALAARQASETRVRQFLADASHELRTPLAAIRGYAELPRRMRAELPPDVAHAMRRVESEAARMGVLVDDLLLLARLDSGRPLAREPVDLSRLLIDTVSDAHAAGPEHRFSLDLPAEEVTVPGDPQRLHQVLANLLGNARTHTPPGTSVVAELSQMDGHAVIRVRDNGPGIPAALLPEIFERFSRADTSRSRAAGSTGLGLSIVAAVVAAHRGTVAVDSEPGRTTFTVRLPTDTNGDRPVDGER